MTQPSPVDAASSAACCSRRSPARRARAAIAPAPPLAPRPARGEAAQAAARPRRRVLPDGHRRRADGDVRQPAVAAAAHEDRALHRALRRGRALLLAGQGASVDPATPKPSTSRSWSPSTTPSTRRRSCRASPPTSTTCRNSSSCSRTSASTSPGTRPTAATSAHVLASPSASRGGEVLPGADPRLQRLHGDRARRARRARTSRPTLRYISEFKREIGRLRTVDAEDLGPAQLLGHQPPAKAGARANCARALGGQVWLTETGGIVQFGGAFPNRTAPA